MYENIDIILATKHKKEVAISGPFYNAFGARIHVPEDFDTDKFGTFTGEVARSHSSLDTVISKASEASLCYGYDYAIASEGSFGPHPAMFFIPADIELICFIDHRNDITVVEQGVFTETNYAHIDLARDVNYADFLQKAKFGTHGLIIRTVVDNAIIAKGVQDIQILGKYLTELFKTHDLVRLETDMRAMMNPTRMTVIQQLTSKLVARLKNHCKKCQGPGFGKASVRGRLACSLCGTETELYQHKVLSCVSCDYSECHERDDGLTNADPQYCQSCNP